MNKTIYDVALLDLKMSDSMRVAGQHVLTREQYSTVFKALEQAQKQEQEHIEYSKKVQEQFSNDTKRIGELESKLIIQEKLLKLYQELEEMFIVYISTPFPNEELKDASWDEIILKKKQIKEL